MAEKDYEAIAKRKITSPSKMKRRRAILVFGRHKSGKTLFGLTAPKVLVLDPEHGTDPYVKRDPHVWHMAEWQDADEYYHFLKLGKHDYEWAFLDGLTRIHKMAMNFAKNQREERSVEQKPTKRTQSDYGVAGDLMLQLVLNLHSLGMGLIMSAQERMIQISDDGADEDEDSEGSTFRTAYLPQGIRGEINALVDVIGRLYVVKTTVRRKVGNEVVEKEVNQRRLWIGYHPNLDTGARSELEVPDFIKRPTVEGVVETINRAEAEVKKKTTADQKTEEL